jgi:pilus assembly protein CpaB
MRSVAKEGRLFIQKNRIVTGIVLIALAAALGLVLYPRYLESRQASYPVLTLSRDIAAGTVLVESDLTQAKTKDQALAEMVFTEINRAVGKSATRDLSAGSYLFIEDAAEGYIASTIYNTLPDGSYMISVSITSLSQSVAGQIRAGDIVRVYTFGSESRITTPKELQYVKVLAAYDSEGKELGKDENSAVEGNIAGMADEISGSDTAGIPAVLSLLVTQEQALKVVELEKGSFLYFSLVSRGDKEASEKYLEKQRQSLYYPKGGGSD